jgi:hypothetical protein
MMNAQTQKPEPCKLRYGRAFHIDRNAKLDRWDVIDDDGRIHGHAHDLGHAIDLAVQQAHNDHAAGHDVMVCVEQEDGTYTMAWSSR